MTTALIVLSAAKFWTLADGTKHTTGVWAEEFLAPYEIFHEAGFEITLATPGGEAPVIDEGSLKVTGGLLPTTIKKFRTQLRELQPILQDPADLADVDQADYDIVFYPGGHGPMEDLSQDATSAKLLVDRLESGRPLGMVCHAPAAIVATLDESGKTPFAGKELTALSNAEETINGLSRKADWLLEDKLKEIGVNYTKAKLPFLPYVIKDGGLYTGQNPQSSKKLATALVDAVK